MTPFTRWLLYPLIALVLGFILDFIIGDPDGFPHPVILIGKLISALEKLFRRLFPKTAAGEKLAGGLLFLIVCIVCFAVPFALLWLCSLVSPWLRVTVEAIFCWQILAAKSLRDACMRVFRALKRGNLNSARKAVSRIVGRDTETLDEDGIIRAAVETAAENTCDGSVAPLLYMAIGGAPLGFLYKAVNTMDSMLGYIDEPYKNIGMIPARADDAFNFIPARISALLMLLSGYILNFNVSNGWKVFKRDRYNHASPNSGQTESACAGLLEVQLGGNASYRGVVHIKKTLGDDIRSIEAEDIRRSCKLLYNTAVLAMVLLCGFRLALFFALI